MDEVRKCVSQPHGSGEDVSERPVYYACPLFGERRERPLFLLPFLLPFLLLLPVFTGGHARRHLIEGLDSVKSFVYHQRWEGDHHLRV
jgi:hypothetical protein